MKDHAADQNVPGRRALIEAVVASTVGTTIEWYDFFLYGVMAALVFPQLFFPKLDPLLGQLVDDLFRSGGLLVALFLVHVGSSGSGHCPQSMWGRKVIVSGVARK